MLSGRFGAVGGSAGAAPTLDTGALPARRPGRRSAVSPSVRPAGAAAGLVLVLAAAGIVFSGAGAVRLDRVRATAPVAVTFAGVDYRLVGVNRAKRIPQRGAAAITASGVFEIVKLRLHAVDRRAHVVSSDLLTLQAGPTYYGVSSPDELGLTDRQWGAATAAMPLPASGGATIKVVFDVPRAVAGQPTALHFGSFGYAAQSPGQTLALPDPPGCCRVARPRPRREALGPLVPSPVLGSS